MAKLDFKPFSQGFINIRRFPAIKITCVPGYVVRMGVRLALAWYPSSSDGAEWGVRVRDGLNPRSHPLPRMGCLTPGDHTAGLSMKLWDVGTMEA